METVRACKTNETNRKTKKTSIIQSKIYTWMWNLRAIYTRSCTITILQNIYSPILPIVHKHIPTHREEKRTDVAITTSEYTSIGEGENPFLFFLFAYYYFVISFICVCYIFMWFLCAVFPRFLILILICFPCSNGNVILCNYTQVEHLHLLGMLN